jgi:hypothetical protein
MLYYIAEFRNPLNLNSPKKRTRFYVGRRSKKVGDYKNDVLLAKNKKVGRRSKKVGRRIERWVAEKNMLFR